MSYKKAPLRTVELQITIKVHVNEKGEVIYWESPPLTYEEVQRRASKLLEPLPYEYG